MTRELQGIGQRRPGSFYAFLLLWVLAVYWPVMALMAENPEFLVAHNASRGAYLLFCVALLLPPIVAHWIVAAFRRLLPQWSHSVQVVLFSTLAILLLLRALSAFSLSAYLSIPVSIVLGTILGTGFARLTFGPISSVGVAILPVALAAWAGYMTGFASIASDSGARPAATWERASGAPVVLILLDQLATSAVINESYEIDGRRWPNLSAFADSATWYPNTTSVSTLTQFAVPALLSGRYPTKMVPATINEYPENLFAYLSPDYEIHAFELATQLNPSRRPTSILRVVVSMLLDQIAIMGSLTAPPEFAHLLPPVDGRMAFFWGQIKQRAAFPRASYLGANRFSEIEAFVAEIDESPNALYFLHYMNPHNPWQHRPDHSIYTNRDLVPGLPDYSSFWPESRIVGRNAQQRYLLQSVTADDAIGEVVDELKSDGVFEEALVVITSDHGITFKPNRNLRQPNTNPDPELAVDLAENVFVPLLIKYPGQSRPVVDLRNAEIIDVVPTIANALEVDWSGGDGDSLLGIRSAVSSEKRIYQPTHSSGMQESLRRLSEDFSYRTLTPMVSFFELEDHGRWIRPRIECNFLVGAALSSYPELFDHDVAGRVLHNGVDPEHVVLNQSEYRNGWIAGYLDPGVNWKGEPLVVLSQQGRILAITRTYTVRYPQHEFSMLAPHASSEGAPFRVDVVSPDHFKCGAVESKGEPLVGKLEFSSIDPQSSFGDGWEPLKDEVGLVSWRWTLGEQAVLYLNVPRGPAVLRFTAWTHGANDEQTVEVFVNEQSVALVEIPPDPPPRSFGPIRIPADSNRPSLSKVSFRFSQWNEPSAGDSRPLAVAFLTLDLREAGVDSEAAADG